MDTNEEQGHPTIESLRELREKFANPAYEGDVVQIDAWEKEVRELLVRDNLANNASLMLILSKFTEDLRDMNTLLLNSDSTILSDSQRDRVLDRKKLYLDFLELFNPETIRKGIQAVDSEVTAELHHVKDYGTII